jgi:hypothetical protein
MGGDGVFHRFADDRRWTMDDGLNHQGTKSTKGLHIRVLSFEFGLLFWAWGGDGQKGRRGVPLGRMRACRTMLPWSRAIAIAPDQYQVPSTKYQVPSTKYLVMDGAGQDVGSWVGSLTECGIGNWECGMLRTGQATMG